jgi:hypothetical protein
MLRQFEIRSQQQPNAALIGKKRDLPVKARLIEPELGQNNVQLGFYNKIICRLNWVYFKSK